MAGSRARHSTAGVHWTGLSTLASAIAAGLIEVKAAGGGGPNWMTMRSFMRDESVKNAKLAPGTIRFDDPGALADGPFGFREVAYAGLETGRRDRVSHVLEQGRIRLVLTGDDGGVTRLTLPDTAGRRWSSLNADLRITDVVGGS